MTTERIISNLSDRVGRLEGGYEHMATKADVAEMELRMIRLVNELMKAQSESESGNQDVRNAKWGIK